MPERNCNIHLTTDSRAKTNTNKKFVRFNLDANVTIFYNNDPRSTKMGLAKWSPKRKNLCRWGDGPSTETKETSGSIPRLPRRDSGKGLLGKTLTNSIEGSAQLPEKEAARRESLRVRMTSSRSSFLIPPRVIAWFWPIILSTKH
jgi:hypothetical protein